MCAINPKRQSELTLKVYTTKDMTDEDWQSLVAQKATEAEQSLNSDARLRWHVSWEDATNDTV